jgi:transcriptional regulator with XRE-family HTH domain
MAKKKVRKQIKKQNKKTKSKPSAKKIKTKISQKISITTTIETNLPSVGSYYIRPKQKGKSFSLYLKRYENGKPVNPHQKIDEAIYYRFGLSAEMTALEAKTKLNNFRKLNKATREEVARQDRTFKRYARSRTINQRLFPQELVNIFEQKIRNENIGTDKHLSKKLYIFTTIQEILNSLKLTPETYAENSKIIFKYFIDNQYSLNYSQKLISMMNEWGKFATAKGSGYFKIIPQPKGNFREKINKGSQTKTGVRKEALPMTQNLMDQIEGVAPNHGFTANEVNFFKATFYLGLRLEELMKTSNNGKHYAKYTDMKSGLDVVMIYQEKLQGVPENKRTKHIPIKWDEQKNAVSIIENRNFQKPTYKKIKALARALNCNADGKALGLYSGRKGFSNWCFDKGEKSHASVASWLGHLDPSTTFAIYLDRTKVLVGDSGNDGTPPKASGI